MIWYIDPINGDNSNSGHSIESPLKDLSLFEYKGESKPVLNHGDKIFIKRGTTLQTKNVKLYSNNFESKIRDYVYVGAYGVGDDPILTHHKILNRKNLIKYTNNIYYVDLSDSSKTTGYVGNESNVGFIYDTNKDVIYGNRVFEMGNLESFMDFYVDSDKLYIYSEELELIPEIMALPLGNNIMTTDANTIYENLHFTLGGAHGLQTTIDGNYNIIIKNCRFDKIGGSKLSGVVRFGNGVEIYGSANDINVQNCIFEDIYDTGVTYQGENSTFKNCSFNNNVFKRCNQACENWCDNKESGEGYINCSFNNNLCMLSGFGFGGVNRDLGHHFTLTKYNCVNTDITVKNNIFFKCKNTCYDVQNLINTGLKFIKNKIYLYDNQLINSSYAQNIANYEKYINETKQDLSSKFIVLDSKCIDSPLENIMLASDLMMNSIDNIYSNIIVNNDYTKQNNQITKFNLESYIVDNVKSNVVTIIDNQAFVNFKATLTSDVPAWNTFSYSNAFKGFTCTQQYINDYVYVNIANGQLYLQANKDLTSGTEINISGVFTINEL